MVNKILNAVSVQLGSTFGNTYKYYVEDVKQNMTKPCFTIDMIKPMERSRSPVLYDRTMPVVVHYFDNEPSRYKKKGYQLAEEIIECLEYLPFEDRLLRGENISWHFVEDVLQIFITYRFITKRVTPIDDNMEELNQNFR